MLEKSSWSHSSNGGYSTSFDGDTKSTPTPCVRSINMKSCDNAHILGDQTFDVEKNAEQYQLNDSSCSKSDLTFFGNGLEEKDNNDLLFYNWPELENFDAVDDVFRGCDSTFGLDIDNSDNFSWFLSSPTNEGTTDAQTSCFDIPNENKSEMQSHVIPSMHQISVEGKRDHPLENVVSLVQCDRLRKTVDSNHLSNSCHSFSPKNHQQEIIQQPCLQTSMSMVNSNSSHPSNQVLPESTTSLMKSEVNLLPTMSPRESSHLSNQMQFIASADDVSLKNLTYSENTKKRKSDQHKSSTQTEKSNLVLRRAGCSDLLCFKKTIFAEENEAECQSKVDGTDTGFSVKLDSCGRENKEGSCMSFILDEFSIDAGSLTQLKHAMVQLDTRTKLCIRDSLYRLARSAAQRHNCDNHNSVKDDKDGTGALLSDGTNKCMEFIDVETDTNPVDRSIAHLLFHRPSDPSAAAAPINYMPMKCDTMVQPPNQLTADKPMYRKVSSSVNKETTEQSY